MLAILAGAGSCVHRTLPVGVTRNADIDCMATVHGRSMAFQVTPADRATRPALFFMTGDGGWSGLEVEIFQRLSSWDYPMFAVSAPEYLKGVNTDDRQLTAGELADDFASLIASGRACLGGLAERPVILVGVSRGADLVVAAAGQLTLRPQLQGVVAISLTAEEEYLRPVDGAERNDMLALYDYLPRLEPLPLAVIQSSGDDYVTADEARREMGPDTVHRRLFPIEASDHSFSTGRDELLAALEESLRWIVPESR